jgi:hypothetical protein
LLAAQDLTAHAVKILNRMPVLSESVRSIAARAAAHGSPRIVLRASGLPDVRLTTSGHGHARIGASDSLDGELIITTDPANRLLVLWGRRSTQRSVHIDGPPQLTAALPAILWPNARPW